jgi:two-component system chemotaxis sensor kinase CheA
MIDQNEYDEFFHDFLLESTELLQDYEKNLLDMEIAFKKDDFSFNKIENNLQSIFRSVHTIKGLAGMMDFKQANLYTHEAEEVLDLARKQLIPIDESLIKLMFHILDSTKKLIENLMTPEKHPFDLDQEKHKFDKFIENAVMSQEPGEEAESPDNAAPKTETTQPKTPSKISSNTIRVDTRRLDDLLDTVGELVIGKNRLIDVSKNLSDLNTLAQLNEMKTNMVESVDQLTRLIENLQETSMKLRMVPVGYTFRKFQRMVRDLAMKKGKEVRLEIEGETTEVDRAVIESMEDPLLHIIRNSIDHGIEPPEERIKKGKDPVGTLKLSASQESNSILIHIEDDGQGIDADKIYRKALETDLVSEDAQLSKRDILNLIFLPGFSTAEVVTDVSGRGVGMDVVKKNVLKLNGMIDLNSEVGKGTDVTLRLPLTLAIIRVLLVKVGKNRYSIPINNIVETLSIPVADIQYLNGREAIQMRESVLPIVRLKDVLEIEAESEKDKVFIVVAGIGEKRIGFVVDALVDQQDIVIKPLGDYLENIIGISGATILGNGQISLVLDLGSLWQVANNELV